MAESAVHDTIVQAPDFDTIQNPAAFGPTEPATPRERDKPAGIDRDAKTRTSTRDKPMARRIANFDTHVTDIKPESGPPSPRAPISGPRSSEATPGAVAMPPSGAPASVPRPQSKLLPVVIAAAATLVVLTGITIPVALRLTRAPVAAPPAAAPPLAAAPAPPPAESTAAVVAEPAPAPTPSAQPTAPRVRPTLAASASAPATSKPAAKKPAPKPGDPSAVGFD
jgi:hypothetical protein